MTINYQPLYLQVKEVLSERISSGVYLPKSAIPSEAELSKEFNLSISTIRQALSLLVSDGVLDKKQGKGTFVTDRKTIIKFLTWYGESPQGERILNKLIEKVNNTLPNIKVEVVSTTYGNLKNDLVNLIANGSAPDLVQLANFWTSYFSSMGALEPLDELITKENLDDRFFKADLLGGIINRKLYSVSWGLCPVAHVANNLIIKKVGVDITKPFTLDYFSEICTNIDRTCLGNDQYSYGLVSSNDEIDFLGIYPFLIAFGGGFDTKQNVSIIDTPENILALKWFRQFISTHKVFTSDIFTIRRMFARGNIAFMSDGSWIRFIMKEHTREDFENNFTILPNPTNGNGKSYSWQYNHSLAICSQSPNKKASAKVIELLTGNNSNSEYFFNESGMLPVSKQQLATPTFETPFFQSFKEQLQQSTVLNAHNPMFEKAMLLCKDAIHRILFENADIETELKEKEYYLKMIYS